MTNEKTPPVDQRRGATVNWDDANDPVVKYIVGLDVAAYVEEYEFVGDDDNYYTPTDDEKSLIEDAINGLIPTIHEELRRLIPSSTPPVDRLRGHLAVTCTDEEAISFLETACRNWSHVPRLSKDDLGDVATALVHFVARKTAAALEGK